MEIRLIKRYKAFPLVQIDSKKYCFNILFWVSGKWEKWRIKKGFYVTVYKFHPFEMAIYY